MASEHSDQTYSSATPYSPDPDSNYSPYSNAAASPPWSAASHNSDTNESQNSLTLPPINNPDVDFARASFFDSLPRLPSPASFFHAEASSSQQEQRPPPSNQQARHRPQPSQYRLSESPDPFDEFVEYTPPQSPENNRERSSSVVDLTNSSSPRMAPVTRKRKSEAEAASIASLSSPPEPASKKRKRSATPRGLSAKAPKAENPDVVDLVGVEDDSQYADFRAKQQAELIKQQREDEANRPVKLAEFQCIICMDNPTDLIVTHCGHLFCSECLHQALHAGNNGRKQCPVCRQSISTKLSGRGEFKKQPKTGVFALEMKLMTANKKGKRPVTAR